MTLTQLAMHNIAPRGINATCVPTSLCFVTGRSYQDVEHILVTEQPKSYRPDIKGNRGVDTCGLLGKVRNLLGHRFVHVAGFGNYTVGWLSTHSPYNSGTYIVQIDRHVLVIKDGVIYDLQPTNLSSKVLNFWKVEKSS
jgi:hypothetical protein